MESDFLKTSSYKIITDFIDKIIVSIKTETQIDNLKLTEHLNKINLKIERTPLSLEKGRFANPNATLVFLKLQDESEYLKHSFGNSKRLDYGTGHELSFLCFCYTEYFKENLKINEVFNLFKLYWIISRRLINKFNLEPAGSKGTWTLDSYQLLPYVFGSAESCNKIQDWYKELLNNCKSVLAIRLFNRDWNQITKDMIIMYKKEVLSRHVVTKSFIYSKYLTK